MIILKVALLNGESQRRHDVRLTDSETAILNSSADRMQREAIGSGYATSCQAYLLSSSLVSIPLHHQGIFKTVGIAGC